MGRRRWAVIAVTAAVALLAVLGGVLLAGGRSREQRPGRVLGLVVTPSEDSWTDDLIGSIAPAAGREGYQLMRVSAERSQESQIEALRSLVVFQVDAIAFVPVVESGWDNVLLEAKRAGIPVICADRSVRVSRDNLPVSYVGYRYQEAAAAIGQACAAAAGAQPVIVELHGEQGGSSFREISRGFRDSLGDHHLEIKYRINGDSLRSRGQEIVAGIVSINPNVDTILCHNDAMTQGAVDALLEAGLVPGTDVRVYAVGGSEEVLALLEQGLVSALAARDAGEMGNLVLEAVHRRIEDPLGEWDDAHYAPVRILTGEVAGS